MDNNTIMALGSFLPVFSFVALLFITLCIIAMWLVFEKAGEQGWKCIIPVYNVIVFQKIIGKPWWWLLLIFFSFLIGITISLSNLYNPNTILPVLSFIFNIIAYVFIIWQLNMLSKSFGKNEGFTAALFFLGFIFLPVLGFGKAKYLGPYGNKAAFDAYGEKDRFDFENNNLVN